MLLLLTSLLSYGQTDDYKEKQFEKHKLENPTKVNDTSSLNKNSKLLGYTLVSINASPCTDKFNFEREDTLVQEEIKNDTLEIEIAITGTCCSSFLGEIEIKQDTILNIIYREYDPMCNCICGYHLTYCILTEAIFFTSLQINGKPVEAPIQLIYNKK